MGTSFVKYKEAGFWTRDRYLEGWVSAVLNELQNLPTKESWELALMDNWRIQALIGGGCMSLGLDELLVDRARTDFMVSVAKEALPHCSEESRRTGELFIALLLGELKTTVSSPIDCL